MDGMLSQEEINSLMMKLPESVDEGMNADVKANVDAGKNADRNVGKDVDADVNPFSALAEKNYKNSQHMEYVETWEHIIEINHKYKRESEVMDMDTLLMPELKKVHTELRVSEAALSAEEKRERHMVFAEHVKTILNLSNIARKEGLLSLEDAAIEMGESFEMSLIKEMLLLIIDGTDPEQVKLIASLKYFAMEQDVYQALKNLMAIYGLLDIQMGCNPRLILAKLKNMIPSDTQIDLDDVRECFDKNTKERPINLEDYCNGGLRIREKDYGYFEIKLAEDVIMSLDNRSLQRVFRDVELYQLGYIIVCLSGRGRKHVFENLSERLAKEVAKGLNIDDPENADLYYSHSEWTLKKVRESAIDILTLINKLESQGEIIFSADSNARFFSIILRQISNEKRSKEERERECEMLMDVIRNFKRYYL